MMGRPLVRRAFELAERLGGMTAYELMARMSREEIDLWAEYDRIKVPEWSHPYAAIMAKLDWIKGVKTPDPAKYLPKVARVRRKRTLAQIKACFDIAAANSTRAPERPPPHGR